MIKWLTVKSLLATVFMKVSRLNDCSYQSLRHLYSFEHIVTAESFHQIVSHITIHLNSHSLHNTGVPFHTWAWSTNFSSPWHQSSIGKRWHRNPCSWSSPMRMPVVALPAQSPQMQQPQKPPPGAWPIRIFESHRYHLRPASASYSFTALRRCTSTWGANTAQPWLAASVTSQASVRTLTSLFTPWL